MIRCFIVYVANIPNRGCVGYVSFSLGVAKGILLPVKLISGTYLGTWVAG
jgi:hypothetical protein